MGHTDQQFPSPAHHREWSASVIQPSTCTSNGPRCLLLGAGCRFLGFDPPTLRGRVYLSRTVAARPSSQLVSNEDGGCTTTRNLFVVKNTFEPDVEEGFSPPSSRHPGARMYDELIRSLDVDGFFPNACIDIFHSGRLGEPEVLAALLLHAWLEEKQPYSVIFASCKGVPHVVDGLEQLGQILREGGIVRPIRGRFLTRNLFMLVIEADQQSAHCPQHLRNYLEKYAECSS